MLKSKRIYESPEPSDGFRVLVVRIWLRGVSKEKARIDLWMKEIAPSDGLRKWFARDPKLWVVFQKRDRKELQGAPRFTNQLKDLEAKHGVVTPIFSARDVLHN